MCDLWCTRSVDSFHVHVKRKISPLDPHPRNKIASDVVQFRFFCLSKLCRFDENMKRYFGACLFATFIHIRQIMYIEFCPYIAHSDSNRDEHNKSQRKNRRRKYHHSQKSVMCVMLTASQRIARHRRATHSGERETREREECRNKYEKSATEFT